MFRRSSFLMEEGGGVKVEMRRAMPGLRLLAMARFVPIEFTWRIIRDLATEIMIIDCTAAAMVVFKSVQKFQKCMRISVFKNVCESVFSKEK